LSRHRTIKFSRSKAIAIAAAGALSIAIAASAADAATQIRWGLEYIKGTYGSPCGAWAHEEATGWY